jgi:hypothetical protein
MRFRFLAVVPVAAALLASGWLLGDDPKKSDADPPPRYKGTLPANFKKIGLSAEQKTNIYKIQAVYGAKIDALTQKIAELKADERAEIDKVLTDAQKQMLRDLRTGDIAKPKDPEKKTDGDSDKKPTAADKKADPDSKKASDKDKDKN